MNRPEDEEDDGNVMSRPELLMLISSNPLYGGCSDKHQRYEHDMSRPARSSSENSKKKCFDTLVMYDCQMGEIDPVSNCMDKSEEDHKESQDLVEENLVATWQKVVEASLFQRSDQRTANR